MDLTDKLNEIKQELIAYCNDRIRLYKFEAIEVYAGERSRIIVGIALVLIFLFLLLFAGIAIALYLNTLLGTSYAGFAIVSMFWCTTFVLFIIFRKSITNYCIHRFLNNHIPS